MTTATVVTYTTTSEAAGDENERLIAAVFDELAQRSPDAIGYVALRLDATRFVHVAVIGATENPLGGLDSFKAFASTIGERTAEGPSQFAAQLLGAYRSEVIA